MIGDERLYYVMSCWQVSLGTLANLTFSQLGTTGCVASSVDTFSLQPLQFNISQAILTYKHTYIHMYIHIKTLFLRDYYSHQLPFYTTYIHTSIYTYLHSCFHIYVQTYIHAYIHTYIGSANDIQSASICIHSTISRHRYPWRMWEWK